MYLTVVIFVVYVVLKLVKQLYESEKPNYYGNLGEERIGKLLKRDLNRDYTVYNNLLIETNTSIGTTQIDHVVVSPYGVFVIETKNMVGRIKGKKDNPNWIQFLNGKKPRKFLNPIKQNEQHVNHLKSIFPSYAKENIHNFVVFGCKADLDSSILSKNKNVCYENKLNDCISKYKKVVFSKEDMKNIKNIIEVNNIKGKKARNKHVQNVRAYREGGLK